MKQIWLLRTESWQKSCSLALLISGLMTVLFSQSFQVALALGPGDVTILLTSGNQLVSDSNNCSGGDGPHAAYVAFQVTNTSGGTLTDLSGTLGDPSAFAGFAFAGGQPATILIGTLTAGQSRTFYWFIEYPCHTAAVISANLTVTVSDSNPGTVALTNTVTAISSISANAGGVLLSSLLGPGFVVGQVIPLDITYAYRQCPKLGDVFIFQPAGNTDFDTSCFQLIRAEVLASDITVITVGTQDQLFFYIHREPGRIGQ